MLVLQNAGSIGAGMPEAGYLPIPAKLAKGGVKDMVRVSDARMSGTAFGTVVLHISPESAVGGPLGLVRNGDRIRLSVSEQRIDVLLSDEELAARRGAGTRAVPERGYAGSTLNPCSARSSVAISIFSARAHTHDIDSERPAGSAAAPSTPIE